VSQSFDVVVIGAGISGLCFAHRVAHAGRKVLLLEAEARAGGCIHSERLPDGFWFEVGAHTLYNSYGSLLTLIERVGLLDKLQRREKPPYRLLVDGKLRSIPSQLKLGELFGSAWRAFTERKEGKSVADYYGRLVGKQNYQRIIGPVLSAVPSQTADGFPADMLFKKRARRKDVPRTFTFAGGLQTLVDALASHPGIALKTGTPVRSVIRAGQGFTVETSTGRIECSRVAVASPPAVGADLLKDVSPELAKSLATIRNAAVDSVGIVARAEHTHLPRVAGIFPIGDIFLSVVSRDVVPDPDRRGLAFHFRTGLPLDQRISRVCEVTGTSREQFLLLANHHATLPSPALGHADIVKAIDAQLPRTGLYVMGNYFGGLALEDCSLRAASEAERLVAESA
jgi:protoporphyrinogen oxidase